MILTTPAPASASGSAPRASAAPPGATAHRVAFDFPELRPGTMVETPKGTRFTGPFGLGVTASGRAWVTASTPTRMELYEELHLGGVPMTFESEFAIVGDAAATYTVRPRVGGVPLPVIRNAFDVIDAGRGSITMRSMHHPAEPLSTLQARAGALYSDIAGPAGIRSPRVERVYQPGDPGYGVPTDPRRAAEIAELLRR